MLREFLSSMAEHKYTHFTRAFRISKYDLWFMIN
jgi:hypothetical protein